MNIWHTLYSVGEHSHTDPHRHYTTLHSLHGTSLCRLSTNNSRQCWWRARTLTHTHMHAYIHTHKEMDAYTHMHAHTCTHTYTCTHKHMHTHARIHSYSRTRISLTPLTFSHASYDGYVLMLWRQCKHKHQTSDRCMPTTTELTSRCFYCVLSFAVCWQLVREGNYRLSVDSRV